VLINNAASVNARCFFSIDQLYLSIILISRLTPNIFFYFPLIAFLYFDAAERGNLCSLRLSSVTFLGGLLNLSLSNPSRRWKKKKTRNELQHRQRKEVSRKSTNFDDIREQPGTAMVVGARKRKTRAIVVEHEIISPIPTAATTTIQPEVYCTVKTNERISFAIIETSIFFFNEIFFFWNCLNSIYLSSIYIAT